MINRLSILRVQRGRKQSTEEVLLTTQLVREILGGGLGCIFLSKPLAGLDNNVYKHVASILFKLHIHNYHFEWTICYRDARIKYPILNLKL